MDNLTHSIAGMLVAEAGLQWAARRGHTAPRGLIYALSISENNMPDLDFVFTPLTEGKLGYLLHHRGHTHTVLIGLAMALLQTALASVWLRRRGVRNWEQSARLAGAISCIGVLVHLLLDFGNNYGVHPFWPLDGRWVYGDVVFIIEPWWWSFGGATLFRLVQSRAAKVTQVIIWALGTVAAWLLPLPVEAGVYCSFLGLLAFATTRTRWTPAQRVSATAGILAFLYAGQLVARGQATTQTSAALAANPSLHVFDLVRTPLPSAPWCWDLLVVALETHGDEQTYVLRLGRATALPGLSAQRCPLMRPATTAPLHAVTNAANERVFWDGEYRLSMQSFARLAQSCWGHAFLRFARAPFVTGDAPVVGDLRFDRAQEIEFTEFELPEAHGACPGWVPQWEAPRRDLLDEWQRRNVGGENTANVDH
jgi:inner membrane protein